MRAQQPEVGLAINTSCVLSQRTRFCFSAHVKERRHDHRQHVEVLSRLQETKQEWLVVYRNISHLL